MVPVDDPRMGTLVEDGLDGDVVIVGFPYDEGCVRNGGRPGAAEGPAKFRRFLRGMGAVKNVEYDVDLSTLRIRDAGDIPAGLALEEAHAALQKRVGEVLAAGGIPFVVGGGNDQSFPNVAALMAHLNGKDMWEGRDPADLLREGKGPASDGKAAEGDAPVPVGVVNLDAHFDVRPLKADVVHSGSPFRLMLHHPAFQSPASRFVEFAAQGSQCSAEQTAYLLDNPRCSIEWLHHLRRGGGGSSAWPGAAVDRFGEVLKALGDNAFVSFDTDSIRGSDMPGVSCPATTGLSADEALQICFLAGQTPTVRMVDVSEMNPAVEGYRSPRLVVNMFYYFCVGLCKRRS